MIIVHPPPHNHHSACPLCHTPPSLFPPSTSWWLSGPSPSDTSAPTPMLWQSPCPTNVPPSMPHQHHPTNVPIPTPTCKILADAQPMTPQCQRAAANAPKLPPIPPPMHYPQHPANADEHEPSNASKASAAVPMKKVVPKWYRGPKGNNMSIV
jgi:hypothetical protein